MKRITIFLLVFTIFAGWNPGFSQSTVLWEIRKPGSENISYLMGTMHQMGNSFTDSLPVLKEKLLHADLAVFESIGNPEALVSTMNQRPSSNEIEKSFSKKDLEALKNIASGWKVNLYKLRPMEVMVKLQQEFFKKYCGNVLPTDKWDHLDNYLIHLARTNAVLLHAFETDSQQTSIINNVDNNNWGNFKKVILQWVYYHTHPQKADNQCDDGRAYRSFRIDYAFAAACNNDPILQQRNEQWMKTLPDLLETNNCFIAVGLFHLFRECGLIQLLRKAGYTVDPVTLR